ncbi:30S ribosomal protein S7 [Patescibacteria group bacterium]|nr:30S ribosomal protein S7 [Patescibacteria group bacterium]
MPRRKRVFYKNIQPDLKYQSVLVNRLIHTIMQSGKKSLATRLVYRALDELEKKSKKPALEALELAIKNVSPLLELKARRIGGANYQVPMEVKSDRAVTLAMRWIIEYARGKSGKSFDKLLATEFLDALNMTGAAIKKKEDTHRMAEANKAFAYLARY